ncbi:Protein canopy-1 [Papilio machaon]|uniref:Protein canopy-1 n=1 Tax=Papilio machaon TaxID=76193 RepID=A0A0N0PBQ0_PAPMA|nr:Protein canopy-1 [Papilio machaon]
MDAEGNTMQQKVPAHRSAVYISELIDSICKKMDDYVRVYYKSTGKLAIMQLMTEEGGMNPEFSKTKFVTDDDLNKSLEYYCERMFEDSEDEITSLYQRRPHDDIMPDAEHAICFNHTKYCEPWMLPTSEDTTWTPEMEAEYVKIHGPDPYGFGGAPPPPASPHMPDLADLPDLGELPDQETEPDHDLGEDELEAEAEAEAEADSRDEL